MCVPDNAARWRRAGRACRARRHNGAMLRPVTLETLGPEFGPAENG
jgi:hypothetical protein